MADGREVYACHGVTSAELPGVGPARLAIWGFSLSGGHIFPVAARNPELAAAIAQTPNADGPAAMRNALRHTTPSPLLRLGGRALLDAVGGLLGRDPLLVPLAGRPGTVAVLTTPDALDGASALNPDDRYPGWRQEVAARSVLRLGRYRPGRYASRIRCPLLVVACDHDRSALPGPAVQAAQAAPHGELACLPGGHYEPFMGGHDQAAKAQLAFLHRHTAAVPGSRHFRLAGVRGPGWALASTTRRGGRAKLGGEGPQGLLEGGLQ